MGSSASNHFVASRPVNALLMATANTFGSAQTPSNDGANSLLVRTNQVAPIIIKNCTEEYQRVNHFNDPIVHSRIAENMPEHELIQNKYFLVRDVTDDDDRLSTLDRSLVPNLRRCKGDFPVYGMGQPSQDGLQFFLQKLKDEGFKTIMLFNVRNEPVLFIREGFDRIPYTPREKDDLQHCYFVAGLIHREVTDLEVRLRTEIINLAALQEKSTFYCYNDTNKFVGDPHMFAAAYEDDLAVTDEIYCRLTFNDTVVRYNRVPLSHDVAPQEFTIDRVIDVFRKFPEYFNPDDESLPPAVVFTSHLGICRATYGMVIGCLLLAHKVGFPEKASKEPYAVNDNKPNYDRAEFSVIRRLMRYLSDGLACKHQVDVIIDQTNELHDPRAVAASDKKHLETITEDYILEGKSAKEFFRRRCVAHVQCYFYLICLNAYLRQQYKQRFAKTFTNWMRDQPEVQLMLSEVDISERSSRVDLVTRGVRYLVSDNFVGFDVLSTFADVKTANFRRFPSLPVYGMAQPSREGLAGVVNYLLSKRFGHPLVIIVNLREDLVVECNGVSYSPRESDTLTVAINMPGIPAYEIEEGGLPFAQTNASVPMGKDAVEAISSSHGVLDTVCADWDRFAGELSELNANDENIVKDLTAVYCEKLISNIDDRFPKTEILTAYLCFDPSYCAEYRAARQNFGIDYAKKLLDHCAKVKEHEIPSRCHRTRLCDKKAALKNHVYGDISMEPEVHDFSSVLSPADLYEQLRLLTPELHYKRLPLRGDRAPTEENFDELLNIVRGQDDLRIDEDGPAIVFHCRTGKNRTTTAMVIAGLIVCQIKGFPYGTKPGEEERVSLPNASYTKGNYMVVQELVRRIPNGQQVKREVDFVLDQCSDTMTPMHYHLREVILVAYNKVKKAKTAEEKKLLMKRSLDMLELYIYIIIFNAYLHCERSTHWQTTFARWMKKVAPSAGFYELLDNLAFTDFDQTPNDLRSRRERWGFTPLSTPFRGQFT
ncbi:Paladin [Lamellibrachia satsuma]|nr:Paladin [Lamellibrachia satsuma]